MNSKKYVLDATAFIRLDFPKLQAIPNVIFFTTRKVASELKDFRSKMNLEILLQTGRLRFSSPENALLQKIKKLIQITDPKTFLSPVDINVLALTVQKKGILVSNDLNLQNAAIHLDIPILVLSGKKVLYPREWQLRCTSCGRIEKKTSNRCSFCDGVLKRVRKKSSKKMG